MNEENSDSSITKLIDYADDMANLEEYPTRIECQNCQEFIFVENFDDSLSCNMPDILYCNQCAENFIESRELEQ